MFCQTTITTTAFTTAVARAIRRLLLPAAVALASAHAAAGPQAAPASPCVAAAPGACTSSVSFGLGTLGWPSRPGWPAGQPAVLR